MGWIKNAAVIAATGALGISAPADAATKRPIRRAPPASAARPVAKPISNTETLARQLFLSRYQSGENLGAACRRTEFKNLAIALNLNFDLLTNQKGEFETSEQYAQRSGKLAEVLTGESIVICESINDNPDAPFAYRADEQRFEGSFYKEHNIWRDVKRLGSYRTKTRMGIPATVHASLEMEYDVAFSLPADLKGCLSGQYGSYKYRVSSPVGEAPMLKAEGRIVYIAKLEAPYIGHDDVSGNPTLDDPYDIYTRKLTIHARPEKIVVINGEGKEVWSCRVGALDPSQAPQPLGQSDRWLTILDYPSRGYRDSPSGKVVAQLKVNSEGGVSECVITGSSGFPDLDLASCAGWTKRAKFLPASDQEGNPIEGEYEVSVVWRAGGY